MAALENLWRDTEYTLYHIGALDPQNKHIWGFETKAQRENFLNAHILQTIEGCKYWKQGETIKVNCTNGSGYSFENSYIADYVKIVNRPRTAKEKVYYCFVVDRKYKNINCTELMLQIDWIQTYYFNADETPFWAVSGYGVATTDYNVLPLRGMGSEFPSLAKQNLWEWKQNNDNIAFVVYSTIDLQANFEDDSYEFLRYNNNFYDDPVVQGYIIDNVYMSSIPYIINCGSTAINSYALYRLNVDLNASGQLGSVTGIYCMPAELSPVTCTGLEAIKPLPRNYTKSLLTINIPSSSSLFSSAGITVNNPILKGYDYTNIIVSNQTGEETVYKYEDFNGNPQFKIGCSFAGGYPCLIAYPVNYKFGQNSQEELFAMKQTQPPNCTMNSDQYAIWQAQNRNSIDAAIASSKLSVQNAKEAQSKSGGIATMLDSMFEKAGDALSSMLPNLGLSEEMQDALTTGSYSGLNALLSTGFLSSFGLEASYTYKQNVKVAEQALKSVEAGFADKRYLPNTSTGSNAYGDLMQLNQYGFNISVVAPSNADLIDLDRINDSSGHICKGLVTCRRSRKWFDFWRMIEPKITNNVYNRPQFVNALLTSLFNDGLYLWWFDDDSQSMNEADFAHPYAVTNPSID
jgi:hypothetical protein